MKAQAEQVLEDGIGRLKKAPAAEITRTMAAAMLYLAQIYVETGQDDKAIALLDDPKIGARTLVLANHAATDAAGFDIATLQTALRAYVATQQARQGRGDDGGAREGRQGRGRRRGEQAADADLHQPRRQAEGSTRTAPQRGQEERRGQGGAGFRVVPDQDPAARQGQQLQFAQLGGRHVRRPGRRRRPAGRDEGLARGGRTTTRRPTRATTRFSSGWASRISAHRPAWPTPSRFARPACCGGWAAKSRTKRRASCCREVLVEKQTIIDAQIEAAYVLQAWGSIDPRLYTVAIIGSEKKKVIWGWGPLARKVQSKMEEDEKLKSVFHEARYNLAVCRLKQAQQAKDDALRVKYLTQAGRDIGAVFALYPDMGGKEWYDKYDSLLKSVQKLKGEKAAGLEALKQAAEEAKKATEAEKRSKSGLGLRS